MLPKHASKGEVYAAQLPDGRYAACQVVGEREKHIEIVGLHWLGGDLPTLEQLTDAPALEVYHHTHKPHVDRVNVSSVPPYWVTCIGSKAPIVSSERPTKAFSAWRAPFHDILRQWRWDHEVPAEEKAAYVRAHRGEPVVLKLGDAEHTLNSTTWRLWLGPQTSTKAPAFTLPVDPDATLDWSELLKLGALTEIVYTGHDASFAEYLRSRKRIRRVVWRDHRQERIDLRGSGVRIFGVDAAERPLELTIDGLADLHLYGTASGLRVKDPQEGWGLRIHLQCSELPNAAIPGLRHLRGLGARNLQTAHLSRLLPYDELQSASLAGAPGELHELHTLSKLPALRRLALRDFYRGDFDAFPAPRQLGKLDTLEGHGLPEKAMLKLSECGKELRCCALGGSKPESWVEEHLNKENTLSP
ncbi:MAG: hypothetical protein JRH20_00400 [Deltaproteobacteria bacterium]|nr:hypothetical protein [Deltaproteobacteria bacterium]